MYLRNMNQNETDVMKLEIKDAVWFVKSDFSCPPLFSKNSNLIAILGGLSSLTPCASHEAANHSVPPTPAPRVSEACGFTWLNTSL